LNLNLGGLGIPKDTCMTELSSFSWVQTLDTVAPDFVRCLELVVLPTCGGCGPLRVPSLSLRATAVKTSLLLSEIRWSPRSLVGIGGLYWLL